MSTAARGDIWMITGAPGSGKSTVCRELSLRLERAVHLEVDRLRWMVGAGFAGPRSKTPESAAQAALARDVASYMACRYAEAGFTVLIDDVVVEHHRAEYTHLAGRGVRLVLLAPSLEATLRRNAERERPFDTSVLEPVIRTLHPMLLGENAPALGWEVLDTTQLDLERTVRALAGTRSLRAEALVI